MKGALAVLKKPFSQVSVERIERMAWQFEVAKSTEKTGKTGNGLKSSQGNRTTQYSA